jgi:hypothetical protein
MQLGLIIILVPCRLFCKGRTRAHAKRIQLIA